MATLSSSKPLWAHPGLTTIFTLGSTWTLWIHYGNTGLTIAILGLPWIYWAQHGNPQHTTANLGSQIYNWHLQIYSSELQIYHNPNINCHYLWNWMFFNFISARSVVITVIQGSQWPSWAHNHQRGSLALWVATDDPWPWQWLSTHVIPGKSEWPMITSYIYGVQPPMIPWWCLFACHMREICNTKK